MWGEAKNFEGVALFIFSNKIESFFILLIIQLPQ